MNRPTDEQILAGLEFIRLAKKYKPGWLYLNAKDLVANPTVPKNLTPIESEWVNQYVAEKQKAFKESAEIRLPKAFLKRVGNDIGTHAPAAVAEAIQAIVVKELDAAAELRVAALQASMGDHDDDIPF